MNITKTPWFLVLGLALGATACATDDSGSVTNTPRNGGEGDVQAACDARVGKYCEGIAPCYSISQSDCVGLVERSLPGGTCSSSLHGSGASHDECMAALDAVTCEARGLPSVCDAILFIDGRGNETIACELILSEYCEEIAPCYSASHAACVSSVESGLLGGSCYTSPYGFGEAHNACLAALDVVSCEATGLPPMCKVNLSIKGQGDAPVACEAVLAKYCERVAPCSSASQSACVSSVGSGLPGGSCSGADRVGETYDACMAALDSVTCEATDLPQSCQEVILYD